MIEFVEARVLANQMKDSILGKRISEIVVEQSPHKFAFFIGDPNNCISLLQGKTICDVKAFGGQLELIVDDTSLVLSDGVVVLYHQIGQIRPKKHQLLLEFEDKTALSFSVTMYGGISCFPTGKNDNMYYLVAKEKPSPLSDEFNFSYFLQIVSHPGMNKLSTKAFLATEQRIPGLGNGLLQDILYHAGLHPKRKMNTLSKDELERMFLSINSTLTQMVELGGRDTEKYLFGEFGGYTTKLSKKTVNTPCPICHNMIQKEAYLGGSIYYCSGCQVI